MAFQFLLLTLVAWWFGTSTAVDAFNAALAVPIAVSAVLAAPLPLVLIPEMVRLFRDQRDAGAWRLASSVVGIFAGVGVILAALIAWQPDRAANLLFSGFDPHELKVASDFLRRLCWLVPLNVCITLLQAVHHARQRFRLAAISNLIGVSVPLLWISGMSDPSLMDIAHGTVAGGVAAVAVLLLPLVRSLASGWFSRGGLASGGLAGGRLPAGPGDVGLRRFFVLVLPLLLAGIYARIDPLVDRMIASHLEPGSIAELAYAQRLMMALATLVSSGLSVAIFPQLVAHDEGSGQTRHARLLALSWRFLIFLLVPCIVAVLIFGRAIVSDLFQRGEFGPEATRSVAFLLSILMGVLAAGSIGEIASKSLYARGYTRGPAVIAVVGFTIGVGLKITLSKPFGIAGVAAGTTLYYLINVSVFLWLIRTTMGREAFGGLQPALLKALVASLLAAAAGAIPVMLLPWGGAIVGGCVGLAIYVAAQSLMSSEFTPRSFHLLPRREDHHP